MNKEIEVGTKVCARHNYPFTGMVGTVTYINNEDNEPYAFVDHGKKGIVGYYLNQLMPCCETLRNGLLVLTGEVPAELASLTCTA